MPSKKQRVRKLVIKPTTGSERGLPAARAVVPLSAVPVRPAWGANDSRGSLSVYPGKWKTRGHAESRCAPCIASACGNGPAGP